MKKLEFNIVINAPKEKVWEVLWNDETYRKWTKPFTEGSYAVSDWNEGSKIQFLSPDGSGMYGIIEKKIPYRQMTFKHEGEVNKGIEEKKDWAGALESYFLTESGNTTELNVETDIVAEFEKMFKDLFPKALNLVKELSEN